MANNHVKDRYDPPSIGTDYEEQLYGDIVAGEIFRLRPDDRDKVYRKVDETRCHDIKENQTTQFNAIAKVYVKS